MRCPERGGNGKKPFMLREWQEYGITSGGVILFDALCRHAGEAGWIAPFDMEIGGMKPGRGLKHVLTNCGK